MTSEDQAEVVAQKMDRDDPQGAILAHLPRAFLRDMVVFGRDSQDSFYNALLPIVIRSGHVAPSQKGLFAKSYVMRIVHMPLSASVPSSRLYVV